MEIKTEEKRDNLIKEYQIIYSLKILKTGIEEIMQDKVLEQYYSMKYVKKLKKESEVK